MTPKDPLILYVDDEKANRIVFEQSFAPRFRVRAAASGREALDVLKSEPVAVLVTDQRMPEMSGQDLLQQAKALYPETVRVVITAYSDLDPILSAVNEGLVARYIIKPWDRGELEQILRWALEAFTLSREGSALQLRLMQTERLVTLGSIAAAVLHDLHQPLGNLKVNGQRLEHLSRYVGKLPALLGKPPAGVSDEERTNLQHLSEELPEIAGELLESCKVMLAITDSMRQFLNPQRAADVPAIDALPILRHALQVCRETAVRARGRLVYEGPAELPKVRVGATELSQVFINLIANGAQALLARNRKGGTVTVHADVQPKLVKFAIVDDGAGMSAETLAKAGTMFFSTRPDGTGLGVAQSRRLVLRAGGELTLESVEGQGTTASFTLPRAD
ncbi:MAG TPA: hybrid sensor histidine kinase/response regulator [Polyangia bacterium]|nr:hybrid sensor histidine kinase/response regulator [Polyangia bacterium]